ncbi:MAG TPA: hypothetical protein VEV17_17305 [Bryobacteraceae bacterium]|nr:hypothetical protein [Bryobacteraceae bacterium]
MLQGKNINWSSASRYQTCRVMGRVNYRQIDHSQTLTNVSGSLPDFQRKTAFVTVTAHPFSFGQNLAQPCGGIEAKAPRTAEVPDIRGATDLFMTNEHWQVSV